MEFLRKKSWKTATPMDRAIFVSMLQNTPVVYTTLHIVTAEDLANTYIGWEWFNDPADLGEFSALGSGAVRRKYFNGGLKLPERNKLNGWYVEPECVHAEFFSAAEARKNGRIDLLISRYAGSRFNRAGVAVDINDSSRVIGAIEANAVKQRLTFVSGHSDNFAGPNLNIGTLFPTVLLPYIGPSGSPTPGNWGEIRFSGFTGVIATDKIRFTLQGRLNFSPRLIEELTIADD
jgi:hypothetical protein